MDPEVAVGSEADVLPTPNFEGSEKRIEIDFFPPSSSRAHSSSAAAVALAAAAAAAAATADGEHSIMDSVIGEYTIVDAATDIDMSVPTSPTATAVADGGVDTFFTPAASGLLEMPATAAAVGGSGRGAFRGLRVLPRESLDELMSLAACCIVSSRSNAHLDAYVLSESSLFVYPTKWVLKTCGTTKLLDAVPRLLELAAGLGMAPRRAKYTRASFLFPEQQPFPYTGFEHEVAFLQSHFGSLGADGGHAYRLGDAAAGLQWHVYLAEADATANSTADVTAVPSTATAAAPVAAAATAPLTAPDDATAAAAVTVPDGDTTADAVSPPAGAVVPTFNLEVCMTELAAECAARFVRSEAFVSAAQTTADSGIGALKPSALIDDYVFEPCGYSMNGIDGSGLMTIHITPEAGQSYASVEVSGTSADMLQPPVLLAALAKIFRPGKMAVALSVSDSSSPAATAADATATCTANWGVLLELPSGYGCVGATSQMHGAGRVTFYTLTEGEVKAAPTPTSPVTALNHGSFLSVGADSDDNNSCLGDA